MATENGDHATEEKDVYKRLQEILDVSTPAGPGHKQPSIPAGGQPSVWMVAKPRHLRTPPRSYDEVYPGIVLGDLSLATNLTELKSEGITHVLNAAQGKKFNQINTTEEFYTESGVKFLGIPAMDIMTFKINKYFSKAAEYIEEAIKSGGKVYVHCHQGLSRSATLVLAFLMLKENMSAEKALEAVRQKREVVPNDGFLRQIAQLDTELAADSKK